MDDFNLQPKLLPPLLSPRVSQPPDPPTTNPHTSLSAHGEAAGHTHVVPQVVLVDGLRPVAVRALRPRLLQHPEAHVAALQLAGDADALQALGPRTTPTLGGGAPRMKEKKPGMLFEKKMAVVARCKA